MNGFLNFFKPDSAQIFHHLQGSSLPKVLSKQVAPAAKEGGRLNQSGHRMVVLPVSLFFFPLSLSWTATAAVALPSGRFDYASIDMQAKKRTKLLQASVNV